MNYLQQYLDEIEAEAATRSRDACANAALIERAGEVVAKINAAAQREIAYPTHHLSVVHNEPSVTIQGNTQEAFIGALEAAGYPLHQLPVEVRPAYGETQVRVTLAAGINALLFGQPASALAAPHLAAEALPCAA